MEQRLELRNTTNVFSTELAGNPLTRTQLPSMAPFLDDDDDELLLFSG